MKKTKKNSLKLILSLLLMISPVIMFSKEYNITIAKMPVYAVSKTEGVLVNLINAMSRVSDDKLVITLNPFSTSVYFVTKQRKDIHLPLIKNNLIGEDDLPFYYSTETQFHVNFVMYSKKSAKLDLNDLSKYKIETDRAHVDYFPFKIEPSNSIQKSIEKVQNGKIDAFIFADFATDPFLKNNSFPNVKRTLYKVFESKMILAKNNRGKEADKMITYVTKKLKASGEFQKIMNQVDLPYDNWQP